MNSPADSLLPWSRSSCRGRPSGFRSPRGRKGKLLHPRGYRGWRPFRQRCEVACSKLEPQREEEALGIQDPFFFVFWVVVFLDKLFIKDYLFFGWFFLIKIDDYLWECNSFYSGKNHFKYNTKDYEVGNIKHEKLKSLRIFFERKFFSHVETQYFLLIISYIVMTIGKQHQN